MKIFPNEYLSIIDHNENLQLLLITIVDIEKPELALKNQNKI